MTTPANPTVNSDLFWSRVESWVNHWAAHKSDEGLYRDAEAFFFCIGLENEDLPHYYKSLAIFYWLFDNYSHDTYLVMTRTSLEIIASAKKLEVYRTLRTKKEGFNFTVTFTEKSKAAVLTYLQSSLAKVKDSQKFSKIGVVTKDNNKLEVYPNITEAFSSAGLTEIDISGGISALLSVKDADGITNTTKASRFASAILSKYLVTRIEEIVDKAMKVKHSQLAEDTEKMLQKPAIQGLKVNHEFVDCAYFPIIQSGGNYNLKISTTSDDEVLQVGVILCSIGARYKTYCANVARTYFIGTTKEQETNYQFLKTLQSHALSLLVPGASCSAVYQGIIDKIRKDCPALERHFHAAGVGFAIGLEFRDTMLSISPTCHKVLRSGMTLNLSLGFQKLAVKPSQPAEGSNCYALLLSDTLLISESGPAQILTPSPSDFQKVSYEYTEEGEEESSLQLPPDALEQLNIKKERDARKLEEKRQEHQKEIAAKQKDRAQEAIMIQAARATDPSSIETYASVQEMPDLGSEQIALDDARDIVLFPISGVHVPFHVTTIKAIQSTENAATGYSTIRVSFLAPGPASNATYAPISKFPDSIFIRELNFRTKDMEQAARVVKGIKDLKKKAAEKEAERRDKIELVAQEPLKLKQSPVTLSGLSVRPTPGGRKSTVRLEAHVNGLRIVAANIKESIEIIYKNIKHAFFHDGTKDIMVSFLFYLHHPIMVGKKKTKEIQVYTEIVDSSHDLHDRSSMPRHRTDDEEMEAELRERELLKKISGSFDNFRKKIEEATSNRLEFEIPFRDLEFDGVPYFGTLRSSANLTLSPTGNCLAQLSTPPFFVLSMDDVDVALLERVRFNLRSFDIVFVFKDYSRPVAHIDAINTKYIDTVKNWLNSIDIKYYESSSSLDWTQILKRVRNDVEGFIDMGGWKSIFESSSEGEEGDDSDDSEESGDDAYHLEGDSEESESYESEESADSDDYDDGEDSDDEDDEDDWDQMSEEAAKEDRRRLEAEREKERKNQTQPKAKASSHGKRSR
eukprot:TRINITY_DN5189_c0_g1_i1.p1 TRINITY_DN5189_c0_g1~~TRINITY_DN5189_c0_g1_i1.p1  ORF type:complete len:1024 (+),score=233.35 TRINITY_DN5189_c0_g1_i1:49-3120(+)